MEPTRPLLNGIDGSTGRYLPAPGDEELLARFRRKPLLDAAGLREYRWWIERHGIDDPNRAPVQGVDPLRLDQSGWGVIFAPDIPADVRERLQPLLNRRKEQAGQYYREYAYRPGMTKLEFLASQGTGPGPADPKKVPYYLLIVGSPEAIPLRFQYEMDVQYAVGRIDFETAEEYGNYARSVVVAETRPARPRQVTFFGVWNDDDPGTESTTKELIDPLSRTFTDLLKDNQDWSVRTLIRGDAHRAQLSRLLGGEETPALLFTASHGMAFPLKHELQLRHQGALLCQDWPGPKEWENKPIPADWYFSAEDVKKEADLTGLIAFHFACYGGGTPDVGDFDSPVLGRPQQIAPRPFLSRLGQKLLGHEPGGALAVLAHVDRAWTTSFSWIRPEDRSSPEDQNADRSQARGGQIETFESVLKRLLEGHPVGSAMEYINQRHAELSVELCGLWGDREYMTPPSRSLFSRIWQANNDARNFVVLGDPAARMAGVPLQGSSNPAARPPTLPPSLSR